MLGRSLQVSKVSAWRLIFAVIAVMGFGGAASVRAEHSGVAPMHTLIGLGFDAYAFAIAGVEPSNIPQVAQSSWLVGEDVAQLISLQEQLETSLVEFAAIKSSAARLGAESTDPGVLEAVESAIATTRGQIKAIEADLVANLIVDIVNVQPNANAEALGRYVLNRKRAVPAPMKVFAASESSWQILERATAHVESGLPLGAGEQAIYFAAQADLGVAMAQTRIELTYQSVNHSLAMLLSAEGGS